MNINFHCLCWSTGDRRSEGRIINAPCFRRRWYCVSVVKIDATNLPTVRLIELTPDIQEEVNQDNIGFKMNQDRGVLIVDVVDVAPNSPAARAGLRPGDIITEVKGVQIQNAEQVQDQVGATPLGQTLQIAVNRNGLTQRLTVRPEQLPAAASSLKIVFFVLIELKIRSQKVASQTCWILAPEFIFYP